MSYITIMNRRAEAKMLMKRVMRKKHIWMKREKQVGE
jgi:hypothetical protein